MATGSDSDSSPVRGQQDVVIPFYVDEQPGFWRGFDNYIIYERHLEEVLGEAAADQEGDKDVRRCFNCGSPEHAVSACPEPFNRQLVALSRQLFEFYKGGNGTDFLRIHELGEWKRQRLEWLEEFEPGLIQGSLLREALGLKGDDTGKYVEWLANMSVWGYPRGWVGSVDPRQRVWELIQERAGEGPETCQAPSLLLIHGDQATPEELLLPSYPLQKPAASHSDEANSGNSKVQQRWAHYPDTYFSSSLLPIYNGMTLPPVGGGSLGDVSTFSHDRAVLWNDITTGTKSHNPPPLPPPPATSPPPLPPATMPSSAAFNSPGVQLDDGEQDMDLSDSE